MLLRVILVVFMVVAGLNHFREPKFYETMMPSFLPSWLHLVAGVFEVVLGLGLLSPFSRQSAFGIVLLLIAVFPANVKCALHPEIFPGSNPLMWWLRLPFQALFIWWAYQFTK